MYRTGLAALGFATLASSSVTGLASPSLAMFREDRPEPSITGRPAS